MTLPQRPSSIIEWNATFTKPQTRKCTSEGTHFYYLRKPVVEAWRQTNSELYRQNRFEHAILQNHQNLCSEARKTIKVTYFKPLQNICRISYRHTNFWTIQSIPIHCVDLILGQGFLQKQSNSSDKMALEANLDRTKQAISYTADSLSDTISPTVMKLCT